MFIPNNTCLITKSSGKTDVFGMPVVGASHKEDCAIVTMNVMNEKSSVRADTSASRGNARELQADALFLLTKTTKASINDKITIMGHSFRISAIFPRNNISGVLDHYQVACTYLPDTAK